MPATGICFMHPLGVSLTDWGQKDKFIVGLEANDLGNTLRNQILSVLISPGTTQKHTLGLDYLHVYGSLNN